MLDTAIGGLNRRQNLLVVVVLNTRGEGFQKILLVHGGAIWYRADISILDTDIQSLLR
jgi:hypothetical protein